MSELISLCGICNEPEGNDPKAHQCLCKECGMDFEDCECCKECGADCLCEDESKENPLPSVCPSFVSHPHMVEVETFSMNREPLGKRTMGCYRCQEALASEEQGTTAIAQQLRDLGISADVHQTGGFTMCVYVPTGGDSYLYANEEGFSLYADADCEGYGYYHFHESENTPEKKAEAIRQTLSVVFPR